MGVMDVWDSITDWVSESFSGIGETFSSIGEFSKYGFIMGLVGVGVLLVTQKWMLSSFTKLMKPGSAVFITILTYLATFAAGYFIGKRFEDQ